MEKRKISFSLTDVSELEIAEVAEVFRSGNLRMSSRELNGIVKKCAVIEYPKSEIGIYQAT